MRMVNSVEREMIQSEWENWLLDETNRCDQVRAVLRAWNSTSSETASPSKKMDVRLGGEATQKLLQEKDVKKRAALRSWHEDYCGSCRQDRDALVVDRESLSLTL
jgi:hypothetical protein